MTFFYTFYTHLLFLYPPFIPTNVHKVAKRTTYHFLGFLTIIKSLASETIFNHESIGLRGDFNIYCRA